MSYPIIEVLLTIAAFALGICGCWVLHRRLRNAGSLCLLCSLLLFVAYCTVLRRLAAPLLRVVAARAPGLADDVAWGMDVLVPALLCLCASVSFLVAARSVRR